MENLIFSFGFLFGSVVTLTIVYTCYKTLKSELKEIEFSSIKSDNISKKTVYTTGGKHVPKVRDDHEARKQEIKKADEAVLKFGD